MLLDTSGNLFVSVYMEDECFTDLDFTALCCQQHIDTRVGSDQ